MSVSKTIGVILAGVLVVTLGMMLGVLLVSAQGTMAAETEKLVEGAIEGRPIHRRRRARPDRDGGSARAPGGPNQRLSEGAARRKCRRGAERA
jgi:hypothetical protein